MTKTKKEFISDQVNEHPAINFRKIKNSRLYLQENSSTTFSEFTVIAKIVDPTIQKQVKIKDIVI